MSGALPDLDFEPTRGFWQAAARHELAVPRCRACGRYVWYPRPRCPDCDGEDLPWTPVSGRGTLFSWARVERALFEPFRDKVPYVAALVALDEDPRVRIVTNLVGCEPEAMRIDMPVRVVFAELAFPGEPGSVSAPCFRPA
jgi:uncharacterized OB-fold protein